LLGLTVLLAFLFGFKDKLQSKRQGVPSLYAGQAVFLTEKYIVVMTDLHFEWDPVKAEANLDKHGISL